MPRYVPSKHLAYYELLEQFRLPGCAVCILGSRAAHHYIKSLCWEHVNDPPVRDRLRAAMGFCGPHAGQLDDQGSRLAIAILYADFLQRAERELEGWSAPRRRASSWARCPACEAVEEREIRALELLAAFIDDPEMAEAYRGSSGLCLRHTLRLCRSLPDAPRRRVLEQERSRLRSLQEELAEVRRKSDHQAIDEPWGEEKTAPSRAIRKVAGEPPGEVDAAPRIPHRGKPAAELE